MGKILPSYRKIVVDEIIDSIFSNTSQYYVFAGNPIEYDGGPPNITNDDYTTNFVYNWQMLFGKRLYSGDFVPVISKNIWTSNTAYDRYDNTSNTLHTNNNFYAISSPQITGASYHVYKCIDNANGSLSTSDPGSIGTPTQTTTFTTSDGYKWRYICSISSQNYDRFSSTSYAPVFTNTTISDSAANYSGVEVVMINNSGNGYITYTNGTIQSVQNSTLIQIAAASSDTDNFYVNNSIYVFNNTQTSSQLRTIVDYVSNASGKFVYVSSPLETNTIVGGSTQYLISPAVVFDTDGDSQPSAYTLVNTTDYSISNVVMLDIGTNISWANVKIQSNYGSGANVYAIVPPPGGHGFDPASELNIKGFAVYTEFSNSENGTIPYANTVYNKVGIFKNPYSLITNIETGTNSKGSRFTANTFNQVLEAEISSPIIFDVGDFVVGQNSGARGTVVFSNTSKLHLSGDKYFIDGENIANSSGYVVCYITLDQNKIGDIYTKDLKPIYVSNINNVNRSNTQTEVFKLTIEI